MNDILFLLPVYIIFFLVKNILEEIPVRLQIIAGLECIQSPIPGSKLFFALVRIGVPAEGDGRSILFRLGWFEDSVKQAHMDVWWPQPGGTPRD